MGLLEELKGRYQTLGDEADGLNARLGEIRTEMNELFSAISALESAADLEEPGLREVRAYTSGRLDGYQQAVAALSPAPSPAVDGGPEKLDTDSNMEYPEHSSGDAQSTLTVSAQREVSNASPGGAEESREPIPSGFMPWSSDPLNPIGPRPADADIVRCWMGGDDYVGPLRGDEFDWFCERDPILAYQIIRTSADAPRTDEPSGYSPVINSDASDYFPTPPPVNQDAAPFAADANKRADESAALAPLFPPEKPASATPEQMMACGYVNDEASWWSRKMAKEQA